MLTVTRRGFPRSAVQQAVRHPPRTIRARRRKSATALSIWACPIRHADSGMGGSTSSHYCGSVTRSISMGIGRHEPDSGTMICGSIRCLTCQVVRNSARRPRAGPGPVRLVDPLGRVVVVRFRRQPNNGLSVHALVPHRPDHLAVADIAALGHVDFSGPPVRAACRGAPLSRPRSCFPDRTAGVSTMPPTGLPQKGEGQKQGRVLFRTLCWSRDTGLSGTVTDPVGRSRHRRFVVFQLSACQPLIIS